MASDTFSNTLGFLTMGTGNDNNSWGNNCNTAVFQIFEDAIANALTSTVTGGTLDLSGSPPPAAASQVRYAALIFTGTLASNQILKVPNLTKWWWVKNATSGAFTLTIQTPSGSASTAIPQNSGWQLVQCDGSNNIIVSPFNSIQIQMPDGSASAPAYSDVNETNSGWYRHGTQDWRLSVNGTDMLQVTGAGASSPSVVNVLAGSLQQAGVQVIPPGTELPYAGIAVPSGFLLEFGQTVSRASYPNLLTALRASFTCTFSNGSPTLSSVGTDLRNLGLEGATLECATAGITNLTISSITATSITMSGNATANSGGTVTVYAYPWGNGDGSTTFGIPDRRGRVIAGRDNMGLAGSAPVGRLTSTYGVNGIQLNGAGGNQSQAISQANLPNVNFTVSGITLTNGDIIGNWCIGSTSPGQAFALGPAQNPNGDLTLITNLKSNVTVATQGSAASGGSGTAFSIVMPAGISNMMIKT